MTAVKTEHISSFYVAGGTMRPDAPSYLERRADKVLLSALAAGEFCHVLTARQMGKSSLIIRTAARQREAGIRVAVLDLTAIGQNLTPEQWYGGLLVQTGQRLGLEDELMECWPSMRFLGPMQRWIDAIRRVVLPRISGPLVVYIDEVDAVRSLSFPTDEFFAGIRDCYNRRGEDPEMSRLTFCLSGVAIPSDLIRDARTTPFNIGHRIELHDFTETEAAPLAEGFDCNEKESAALLKRILFWTGGHPYLTQRLCQAIAADAKVKSDSGVDLLCEDLFFSRRAQERDHNLLFVRDRMLEAETEVVGLLELYAKVRSKRVVQDDETNPLVSTLRLCGITRAKAGRIEVRNRIYARVFNKVWVKASMPGRELRRQRAAFRRGMLRTAIVSALILAPMGWLSITVVRERNRAEQQIAHNRRLLYFAQIKLAREELENANISRVEELLASQIPRPGEEEVRGFEWYLLYAMAHRDVARISEGRPIEAAVFLPGDKTLAIGELLSPGTSGSDEYSIKLYDLESHREVSSFQVPAGQNFDVVVFSPDRTRVAVDAPDGRITVWDVRSGNRVAECRGHSQAITNLTFSPDGLRLISAGLDGEIKTWDPGTGHQQGSLSAIAGNITCVAVAPDSKSLATTDGSEMVRVFDAKTMDELVRLQSANRELVRCSFFPDGNRLLTSAKDGLLQVWDIRSRRIVAEMVAHSAQAQAIAFSPDGASVATASNDRTVRVWDTESARLMRTIRGHGAAVKSVMWSANGKMLLTGSLDGSVKLWRASAEDGVITPVEPPKEYYATRFSSNGDLMALGGGTDGSLTLWNLSTGQVVSRLEEFRKNILCAAFSHDARRIATGGMDHKVKVWDVSTGRRIPTLNAHTGYVKSVEFSPDDEILVSAGEDRTLRLWNIHSEQLVQSFDGGIDNYFGAVFSPDGKILASSCRDGSVRLSDVPTGKVIATLVGHTYPPRAIAFSRDGTQLATGGRDNTVRLWDVSNGTELSILGQSDSTKRVAFSFDGRRLVTGGEDGYVRLWDLTTQQELLTLHRHPGGISSVSFSADGRSLATSGQHGTINVWRTEPVP